MNDENQENEARKGPLIPTIPASLTVPGFGFLVALNPDWRLTWQERKASSAFERLVATLRLCQVSNLHSRKAFRIAQNKQDAGGWSVIRPSVAPVRGRRTGYCVSMLFDSDKPPGLISRDRRFAIES